LIVSLLGQPHITICLLIHVFVYPFVCVYFGTVFCFPFSSHFVYLQLFQLFTTFDSFCKFTIILVFFALFVFAGVRVSRVFPDDDGHDRGGGFLRPPLHACAALPRRQQRVRG
jgi:hypothetical protein